MGDGVERKTDQLESVCEKGMGELVWLLVWGPMSWIVGAKKTPKVTPQVHCMGWVVGPSAGSGDLSLSLSNLH